jgi:hypothetical protein
MLLRFTSSPPLFIRRSYRSRHGSHAALDLGGDEFELARRKTESFREADRTTVVDQYDQTVFTVEQPVDQFMNPASVITQCLSKGHGHSSALRPVCALDVTSATGRRPAPPAFEWRGESFARERRNVSSCARVPKISIASDQSVRASA